jgi:hypothetical protein
MFQRWFQPAITSSVTTAQTLKDPDTDSKRALLRSAMSAVWVPLLTTPLIQLETNITSPKVKGEPGTTSAKRFRTALEITRQEPWKGYKFVAKTSFARGYLLFYLTPKTFDALQNVDYFKQNKYSQDDIKAISIGVAGTTEGAIMAFRTPLLQFMHTYAHVDKNYNRSLFIDCNWALSKMWKTACHYQVNNLIPYSWSAKFTYPEKKYDALFLNIFKDKELMRAWGVSLRYGIIRDLTFWPIYAKNVGMLEKYFFVDKQKESFQKLAEEFLIGASSGLVASIFSFPMHGFIRRAIRDPQLILRRDIANAWQTYGHLQNGGMKVLRNHFYVGWGASAMITFGGMGMLNLSKHLADVIYDSQAEIKHAFCKTPSVVLGFFKIKPIPQEQIADTKESETLLHRLSSC